MREASLGEDDKNHRYDIFIVFEVQIYIMFRPVVVSYKVAILCKYMFGACKKFFILIGNKSKNL